MEQDKKKKMYTDQICSDLPYLDGSPVIKRMKLDLQKLDEDTLFLLALDLNGKRYLIQSYHKILR